MRSLENAGRSAPNHCLGYEGKADRGLVSPDEIWDRRLTDLSPVTQRVSRGVLSPFVRLGAAAPQRQGGSSAISEANTAPVSTFSSDSAGDSAIVAERP